MPPNFYIRYNAKGETPEAIFTKSHENLVRDGGQWLKSTAESCSIVATVIVTVAFAATSSIPGGTKDQNGKPTLENKFAMKIFGITSLVSLCFSVTSMSMFLSILLTRYQEKDFERSLPWKLILGLTSLFVSVASVLISFCSAHFLVLRDTLKYAAIPVYAFNCLLISFFAVTQFPLHFDLIKTTFRSPFRGSSSRVKKYKKLIQVERVPLQIVVPPTSNPNWYM
ncbi:hypothetical protein TIFTF001_034741 [Ficus carica]|uniref:PGG domain-containing protein n=1 Tax=Ficus carica TaxID=3494 RepID=A0AA88J5K3_FICCA|nr:hypothetical protein TIFTF001_034741 [Ficus carica]